MGRATSSGRWRCLSKQHTHVAIIAGLLGFTTIAGASIALAKILFMIFLVLFVVSLVMHLIRGRTVV